MTTKNSTAYSRLQGKKLIRLSLFACVLTAGLFTACSSDDDGNTIEAEPQAPRLITVEVSETPLEEEGAEARAGETRGDITYTSTLSTFNMHGIYNGISNYAASKANNNWTLDPNLWPSDAGNNDVIPFYAHTGGTFFSNSGTPYINFTMSEDAFYQHDLLWAYNTASYDGDQDKLGKVSLTFHHACAAVAFKVQLTNTLSAQLTDGKMTVNSIQLKNVKNKGKYHFGNPGSWTDVQYDNASSSTYTLTNTSEHLVVTNTLQPLPCNWLFIIPQTTAENGTNGTYLEINYGDNKTATIPFATNWEGGKKYTIIIRLGTKLIPTI
jgi:hypothetical protein